MQLDSAFKLSLTWAYANLGLGTKFCKATNISSPFSGPESTLALLTAAVNGGITYSSIENTCDPCRQISLTRLRIQHFFQSHWVMKSNLNKFVLTPPTNTRISQTISTFQLLTYTLFSTVVWNCFLWTQVLHGRCSGRMLYDKHLLWTYLSPLCLSSILMVHTKYF